MYQLDLINCTDKDCFDNMKVPDNLVEIQEELSGNIQKIKKTCFIWDKMMVTFFINDINYFKSINLFSDENLESIRGELMLLLDELEDISARGTYRNGNSVEVYISNINFETSYSYYSSDSMNLCMMRTFGINTITTQDIETFNYVKNWINSLKKFSTMISQSVEMQRIQFFRSQRELVKRL